MTTRTFSPIYEIALDAIENTWKVDMSVEKRTVGIHCITCCYNQGMQNAKHTAATTSLLLLLGKNRTLRLHLFKLTNTGQQHILKSLPLSNEFLFQLQHSDARVWIWWKQHESMDPSSQLCNDKVYIKENWLLNQIHLFSYLKITTRESANHIKTAQCIQCLCGSVLEPLTPHQQESIYIYIILFYSAKLLSDLQFSLRPCAVLTVVSIK